MVKRLSLEFCLEFWVERRGDTGIVSLGEFITSVRIAGEFNFEIIGLDPILVYFGVGERKIFIISELKFYVNCSLG